MERFKRRPIAAAMLLVFSAPVLAQSQAEQTLPEVRVRGEQEGFRTESTGTATRTETPLRDIPQFINTVPQEVLRSQGATTLGDALRNVPGISYAAPEGGTQANNVYYLRGFPAGGDLFLDSVRDIGEYNRDLFGTETVEILKGPSALLFGRGGSGGVVNQISKSAGLIPRNEVAFQFGSFDQKYCALYGHAQIVACGFAVLIASAVTFKKFAITSSAIFPRHCGQFVSPIFDSAARMKQW